MSTHAAHFCEDVGNFIGRISEIYLNITPSDIRSQGLNNHSLRNYTTEELTITQSASIQLDAIQENITKFADQTRLVYDQHNTLQKPRIELIPRPINEMTIVDSKIIELVLEKIWYCVNKNKLYKFFAQDELQNIVNSVTNHDYFIIMKFFNIKNINLTTDLALLSLYNIIIVGDDSGSMVMSDPGYNMSRYDILKQLISIVSFFGNLFNEKTDLKFLNMSRTFCIREQNDITNIFNLHPRPDGNTMIGSTLNAIYDNLQQSITSESLQKPVLVYVFTDGQSNDNVKHILDDIMYRNSLSVYGKIAMTYKFVQIGNDGCVNEMFRLINDIEIVNCIGSYESEHSENAHFNGQNWPIQGYSSSTYIANMLVSDPLTNDINERSNQLQITSSQFSRMPPIPNRPSQRQEIHNALNNVPRHTYVPSWSEKSKQLEINSNDVCPITLSTIGEHYSTCQSCKKNFDYYSIVESLRSRNTCPMCRRIWSNYIKYKREISTIQTDNNLASYN